jgi:hypothetical protein
MQTRVARLGEFSPFVRVLSLGSFSFKYYGKSPKIRPTFFHGYSIVLISTKHGFGLILGDFFHKLIWSL